MGVILVYIPLYLHQSLGMSGVGYATLFTLLMVGSVVGPLFMGHLSDVLSRERVLVAAYILSAASMVALVLVGGRLWLLGPTIVALGLVVYAQSSLVRALLADVSPEGERGSAYSTFYVVSYLGGSIWSLAMGLVVDASGFRAAFVLMAASYLAALLAVAGVRSSSD